MKISDAGLKLIKQFEGCKLEAYKDSKGIWTIGYGLTNACKSITGLNIKSGVKITQAQAEKYLQQVLDAKYIPLVAKYDSIYHFNQNQIDALTSFCYNIGSIDALTNKGKRTIKEISAKMPEYCKCDGKVLSGLKNRRLKEQALFNAPVTATQTTQTASTTTTAKRKFLYNGIDYSPVFDPTYYAKNHPDVVKVYGTDATKLFNHFTIYGMREGRQASAAFNPTKYRTSPVNKDLVAKYGTNYKLYYYHFIVFGRNEANRKGTY